MRPYFCFWPFHAHTRTPTCNAPNGHNEIHTKEGNRNIKHWLKFLGSWPFLRKEVEPLSASQSYIPPIHLWTARTRRTVSFWRSKYYTLKLWQKIVCRRWREIWTKRTFYVWRYKLCTPSGFKHKSITQTQIYMHTHTNIYKYKNKWNFIKNIPIYRLVGRLASTSQLKNIHRDP